jgi:hypothetical protein
LADSRLFFASPMILLSSVLHQDFNCVVLLQILYPVFAQAVDISIYLIISVPDSYLTVSTLEFRRESS